MLAFFFTFVFMKTTGSLTTVTRTKILTKSQIEKELARQNKKAMDSFAKARAKRKQKKSPN